MIIYNSAYIGHTTVADFKVVAVEDFVERMGWREFCFYKFYEHSAYISGDTFTVRWIEPEYLPLALSVAWCSRLFELELVLIAAFI